MIPLFTCKFQKETRLFYELLSLWSKQIIHPCDQRDANSQLASFPNLHNSHYLTHNLKMVQLKNSDYNI